nr:MAG TPA: hypothetical protein [Caudoviricetes sp.]
MKVGVFDITISKLAKVKLLIMSKIRLQIFG